jgi:dihydroneopterin aldolase
MTNEVRLAFSHPDERAKASPMPGISGPLDRISLRDHIVEVEIGAFQAERGTTQRVCFNVVVEVQPVTEVLDDDVDRILSYDRVTEAIADSLAEERLNLLETLADRVASRILSEPQAVRAFVRIEKLDRGPGALGVEIVRNRQDYGLAPEVAHNAANDPRVIYLTNEAIAAPHLSDWLDQLAAGDRPAILCVGLPDRAETHSAAPLAQRRIDLLSIEQNAWVLAGRDRRCVVVGTRTELDWGMKHGQISVWAPSKIVLDAVEGPHVSVRDTEALSRWFASEMDAAEVIFVSGGEIEGVSGQIEERHHDLRESRLLSNDD